MIVNIEFKDTKRIGSVEASSIVVNESEIKGKVTKVATFAGPMIDAVKEVPLDCIVYISDKPLPRSGSELSLKWWQAKMLQEQIIAAQEASRLGREGKFTMDNGCVIEWDNFNVRLEVPEDEPESH